MPRQSRASGIGDESPSDERFVRMEQETFEKVSATISTIDRAVAAWTASPAKPGDVGTRIEKLKRFQGALNDWVKEYARLRGATRSRRMETLVRFIDICYAYENS